MHSEWWPSALAQLSWTDGEQQRHVPYPKHPHPEAATSSHPCQPHVHLLAPAASLSGSPCSAGQSKTLGDLRAIHRWGPQDTDHPDGHFDPCRAPPLPWVEDTTPPTTTTDLPPLRRTEGTFLSPRWKPQFSFWGCGLEIM